MKVLKSGVSQVPPRCFQALVELADTNEYSSLLSSLLKAGMLQIKLRLNQILFPVVYVIKLFTAISYKLSQ